MKICVNHSTTFFSSKLLKQILPKIMLFCIIILGLSNCSSTTAHFPALLSFNQPSTPAGLVTKTNPNWWEGNASTIWTNLQPFSSKELAAMRQETTDPQKQGWLSLALLSKQNSTHNEQLMQALAAWREQYPSHPGNQLFPSEGALDQLKNQTPMPHIALLLPQQGSYAASGQAVREGFLNAYYAKKSGARGPDSVKLYDTQSSSVTSLYRQAVAEGADFVIGPLLKQQVQQLAGLGSFPVMTLALNYTDYGSTHNRFYEFGLLPEDETGQMASHAYRKGVSRALIIASPSSWSRRLVSSFSAHWQRLGGKIQESWYYPSHADFNQGIARLLGVDVEQDAKLTRKNTDKSILEKQRRTDFDVIFLFASEEDARVIVPLLHYYYANNVPIYSVSSIYSSPSAALEIDLRGVIICDIPRASAQTDEAGQSKRLYALGQDAYLLSQVLPRMAALPSFSVYGETGALIMTQGHQIHRRLPCKPIGKG